MHGTRRQNMQRGNMHALPVRNSRCIFLCGPWVLISVQGLVVIPLPPLNDPPATLHMQPFEFVVGQPVSGSQAKKSDAGSAGGLFVGGGGPKPPPALSTAVIGMKPGGKVSWASI